MPYRRDAADLLSATAVDETTPALEARRLAAMLPADHPLLRLVERVSARRQIPLDDAYDVVFGAGVPEVSEQRARETAQLTHQRLPLVRRELQREARVAYRAERVTRVATLLRQYGFPGGMP